MVSNTLRKVADLYKSENITVEEALPFLLRMGFQKEEVMAAFSGTEAEYADSGHAIYQNIKTMTPDEIEKNIENLRRDDEGEMEERNTSEKISTNIDKVFDYLKKHHMLEVDMIKEKFLLDPAQADKVVEVLLEYPEISLRYKYFNAFGPKRLEYREVKSND